MSLKRQATSIGLSSGYFYVIKNRYPLTFRYMRFIGRGNLAKGYTAYIDEVNRTRSVVQDIYYKFESEAFFLKFLVDIGIYRNKSIAYSMVYSCLFRSGSTKISFLKKLKKIERAFNGRENLQKSVV